MSYLERFAGFLLLGCGGLGPEYSASLSAEPEPTPAATTRAQRPVDVSVEALACATQFPAKEPFEVGDAQGDPVATIAAQCRAQSGTNCAPGTFISRQAALCVAESADAVGARVQVWSTALDYHAPDRRVEWLLSAWRERDGECCGMGWSLRIDASTGDILAQSGLQRICCNP
jgi:hypothetical protein